MPNNKSIQILRTDVNKKDSSENTVRGTGNENKEILAGQPILDSANNWLYVGVSNDTIEKQESNFGGKSTKEFQTIHPNYSERCLTEGEVEDLWLYPDTYQINSSGVKNINEQNLLDFGKAVKDDLNVSSQPATGEFLTNVTQENGKITCEYSDSIDGLKWDSIRFDESNGLLTPSLDAQVLPETFNLYKNCTMYHWAGWEGGQDLPNGQDIGGFSLLNIVEKNGGSNEYFDLFQIGVHFRDFIGSQGDNYDEAENLRRLHTPLLYRAGDETGWLPGTGAGSWVELLDTYGGQTINGNLTVNNHLSSATATIGTLQLDIIKSKSKSDSLKLYGALNVLDGGDITVSANQTERVYIGGSRISITGQDGEEGFIASALGVVANQFNAYSDKRLKKNISPYQCKKSILDLPIYEFDYINSNTHTIGCLAQDLQEICPEIVAQGENGYLSINESKLIYLLLEEVKRLNSRIEMLEKGME